MKLLISTITLISTLSASAFDIRTFASDFTQTITDEKNKVLTYKGDLIASKTQNALWDYTFPIKKTVYLNRNKVTIVEPEIEQVIIRYVDSNLNFFKMLQNAKMVQKDRYVTSFKNIDFTIITKNESIKSISYIDEFENKVDINFTNQQKNIELQMGTFTPKYDNSFDIIRD